MKIKTAIIGLAMLCLSAFTSNAQTGWVNAVPAGAVPIVGMTVDPWNSAQVSVPITAGNHYYFEYIQVDTTNQVYEWTPAVNNAFTDTLLGPPDGPMTLNVYSEAITPKPLIRRK